MVLYQLLGRFFLWAETRLELGSYRSSSKIFSEIRLYILIDENQADIGTITRICLNQDPMNHNSASVYI